MDNSVVNFIIFLIFTGIYFSKIRGKATLQDYSSDAGIESYYNSVNMSLLLYFGITLLSQLVTNVIVVMNMCGGSFKQNLSYTALITFIPWILIFGIVIILLISFPNFKNAFSDVVGYYSVSTKANIILLELLNHSNKIQGETETIVNENMDGPSTIPSTDTNVEKLNKLENEIQKESTDLIAEIFSNLSLLINKITPVNFNEYWDTLRPLMKPQYASLNDEQDKYCYQLADISNFADYLNQSSGSTTGSNINVEEPSAPPSAPPDYLAPTIPSKNSPTPAEVLSPVTMIGGTKKYLKACMQKMMGGGDNDSQPNLKIDGEAQFQVLQKYSNLKQQMLNLVIYRDSIGEAMWYIYTGLLLSTILKYNINNRGCVKSVTQIQSNLNNALTTQQQDQALALAQQRVQTVS
uniref:Uncharacterized protein n=1 Tax=viral metagenome TaxID=1070528 RepID=A0A6C0EEW6_9ZZZZ